MLGLAGPGCSRGGRVGGEAERTAISPPIRRPASHRSTRPVESIAESIPTVVRSTNACCLATQAYHPSGTDLPRNLSKRQPVGSTMTRRRRVRPLMMASHRSSAGISLRQPGSRVVIGTSPLQMSAASTIPVAEGVSTSARLSGAPRTGSITMNAATASSSAWPSRSSTIATPATCTSRVSGVDPEALG